MHPVAQLWDELQRFADVPYPAAAERIRREDRVDGTAFFPVGSGLWGPTVEGSPPLPEHRDVMVVGNNFANRRYVDRIVARGFEVDFGGGRLAKDPTWRRLLGLLSEVPLLPEHCFFTNAYMAFIAGNSSLGNLGLDPHDPLEIACQQFFGRQVELLQPRTVVCLGASACAFVARHCRGRIPWPTRPVNRYFATVDANDAAIQRSVRIGTDTVNLVALVHPSYRHLNAGTRPETQLLRSALALAS